MQCEEEKETDSRNSLQSERHWRFYRDLQATCESEEWQGRLGPHLKITLGLIESDENNNNDINTAKLTNSDNFITYRNAMIAFIKHEATTGQRSSWNGEMSALSSRALALYAQSTCLSDLQLSYARFSALAGAYQLLSLDLKLFENNLDALIEQSDYSEPKTLILCVPKSKKKLVNKRLMPVDREIENTFWEECKKLFKKFAKFIVDNLHSYSNDNDSRMAKITRIKDVLSVVKRVEEVASAERIEEIEFGEILYDALSTAVESRLTEAADNKATKDSNENDEVCLNFLIRLVKSAKLTVRDVLSSYSDAFQGFANFPLAKNLYLIHDDKLEKITRPIVIKRSQNLKPGARATTVMAAMKLYDELLTFTPSEDEAFANCELLLKKSSDWFPQPSFSSVTNVTPKFDKAIELDCSSREFTEFKRSSSAADARDIIDSVMRFWMQCEMPADTVDILEHVANELCRYTVVYIDKYSRMVESTEESADYYLPLQMSIAIANFNFMSLELQGMLFEFGKDKNMAGVKSCMNIINQTFAIIDRKTSDLIELSLRKFGPKFMALMVGAAESESSSDEFLHKISDTLAKFESNLKGPQFDAAKLGLWREILGVLPEVSKLTSVSQYSHAFFINLNTIWLGLKAIFDLPIETEEMRDKVTHFEEFLEWFSLDSSQLIYRHYENQTQAVARTATATVLCSIKDSKISVEILHAQKLDLLVPKESCNSFIKVRIFCNDKFTKIPCLKTRVHKNTNCPLFEEKLEFELTHEQRRAPDAMIFFRLKRQNAIGYCKTLGEAFLSFCELSTAAPVRKEIKFLKMTNDDCESLRILKHRRHSIDGISKRLLSKIERRKSLQQINQTV